ncbi:MAG TPA: hypothetical protein VGI66_02210, partial [Streptosporangiaceae bacterium]
TDETPVTDTVTEDVVQPQEQETAPAESAEDNAAEVPAAAPAEQAETPAEPEIAALATPAVPAPAPVSEKPASTWCTPYGKKIGTRFVKYGYVLLRVLHVDNIGHIRIAAMSKPVDAWKLGSEITFAHSNSGHAAFGTWRVIGVVVDGKLTGQVPAGPDPKNRGRKAAVPAFTVDDSFHLFLPIVEGHSLTQDDLNSMFQAAGVARAAAAEKAAAAKAAANAEAAAAATAAAEVTTTSAVSESATQITSRALVIQEAITAFYLAMKDIDPKPVLPAEEDALLDMLIASEFLTQEALDQFAVTEAPAEAAETLNVPPISEVLDATLEEQGVTKSELDDSTDEVPGDTGAEDTDGGNAEGAETPEVTETETEVADPATEAPEAQVKPETVPVPAPPRHNAPRNRGRKAASRS